MSSSEFRDSDSAHSSLPTLPLVESPPNQVDEKGMFSTYGDLMAFLKEFQSVVSAFFFFGASYFNFTDRK